MDEQELDRIYDREYDRVSLNLALGRIDQKDFEEHINKLAAWAWYISGFCEFN